MKIRIGKNDNLPEGEYELTSREKLENALGNLSYGRSDREKLLEYDRIAGRTVKDGVVLSPQSLWKLEQEHMNKPIEQFTDEELLAVIRRAENVNVPGSFYQRASNEGKLRQDQRMLNAATRKKWSSERVPVGYPMSCSSDQIRDVIQDLSEEKHDKLQKGKFNIAWEKIVDDLIKNGQAELAQRRETRRWYEKPIGMIAIGIVIGLVVAYLTHYFGWV
ncbi:MAG: hypothetical protein Q7S50_01690 [bacterium]|nr:hypothetical protein [bacterium]